MAPLLHVDNISVSFDGFKAINGLSFEIGESELRAIIGPNGAGKTTFMDIVTGKTRPDSGDVRWGGASGSLLKRSESQIAQLGIGRKFQKPTTFEDQTVHENLLMSLANNRNPFAVLAYRRSQQDDSRILAIAEQIKLADDLDRFAGVGSRAASLSPAPRVARCIASITWERVRASAAATRKAKMAKPGTTSTRTVAKAAAGCAEGTSTSIEKATSIISSIRKSISDHLPSASKARRSSSR